MFEWFKSRRRKQKEKEQHEKELKARLAKKIELWRDNAANEDITENLYLPKSDDYTELTIDDRKVKVRREKIVLNDVWSTADPSDSGKWKRNRDK